MIKYFWDKAPGLNADIERHRNEEVRLEAKIAELEAMDPTNKNVQMHIRTYRHFLYLLHQSKAEVVNNIGRNNDQR